MKKEIIAMLFISILLLSPLVLAQEQDQIYSGFDRFLGNIKMFFSFGDKKVMLALEIREKEVNSAIENIRNGNDVAAAKNLENALKRIQLVQKKVSLDMAEEVKTSVDKIVDKINEEENLPDDFEVYVLEEEKTQLTAELVIEVEGKEGQTLTREIVKDSGSGTNKVEIAVEGGDGQTKIMEIEEKIAEINNQIAERVVKNVVGEGNNNGDDGLTPVIKTDVAGEEGDDGLKPVVKTDVAGGNGGDDVSNNLDSGGLAPGTTNEAPGDTIVEGDTIEDSPDDIVDEGDNQIDQPPKDKDNEDVSPPADDFVDVVDDGPGEPGVIDKD